MLAPRVLILRAPGTNCDHETAHAFERAGGLARRVHVRALAERPAIADDCQILCIPGGFSYGDDIASGRIFALELRTRLGEALATFRDKGGLVLGICNGFQVLVQTGLLLADPVTGCAGGITGAQHVGTLRRPLGAARLRTESVRLPAGPRRTGTPGGARRRPIRAP